MPINLYKLLSQMSSKGAPSPSFRTPVRTRSRALNLNVTSRKGGRSLLDALRVFDPEHVSPYSGFKRARSRSPAAGLLAAVAKRMTSRSSSRGRKSKRFSVAGVPRFQSGSGGVVTISHRECVGSLSITNAIVPAPAIGTIAEPFSQIILTSAAGVDNMAQGLVIRPTLGSMFPWLSTIASRFEQYKWKHINIQFVSSVADGSTANINLGNLMSYVEYDAANLVPAASANVYMNQFGATTAKPSSSFKMGVQARGNPFTLKWTQQDAAADPRFAADGRLFFAQDRCPNGVSVGYLWVEYSIELHKPQVRSLVFVFCCIVILILMFLR